MSTPAPEARRGLTLGRRLGAALGIAAFGLVLLVVATSVLLVQVHRQQHLVTDRYFLIVNDSNTLFVDLVDAETAVRGYALTGDASTLTPLNELQGPGARQTSAELTRLVAPDPQVAQALRTAGAAASTWFNGFAQPTLNTVRQRGPRAVRAADVQHGRVLFDDVRTKYREYTDTVLERRAVANRRLEDRLDLLFVAVIVGAAGAVLIGVLLALALRRWITRPIERLAGETRLVRSGALDHAVTVEGPPEIRALGSDVESMRRRLVAQLAQVEAVRDGLQEAQERLEAQAAELARSNRDLEQFAYVASHDLQEPLRKVASFCQLLERRYAGKLDERADQYIAFAVDGAKRMQQLINDLLAFSRIGRRTTGRAEVPLQSCLDGALRNLETAIEETGAEIEADELPTVWGEKALLTALLQNLVSNAIKFRSAEPVRVRLTVHTEGEEHHFSCSDNGIGIEARYAERIFVIFQRLHAKDEYSGTGIGLALCKKIVEWHGGRIWLDTERTGPGFGTTFAWTLPVAAVGHAIMDPAPPTTEHSSPESEAAENQAVEHVARQDHDAQGQSRSVVLSTEGGQG